MEKRTSQGGWGSPSRPCRTWYLTSVLGRVGGPGRGGPLLVKGIVRRGIGHPLRLGPLLPAGTPWLRPPLGAGPGGGGLLGLAALGHLLRQHPRRLLLQLPDVLHRQVRPLVLPAPSLAVGAQHHLPQTCDGDRGAVASLAWPWGSPNLPPPQQCQGAGDRGLTAAAPHSPTSWMNCSILDCIPQ